MAKNPIGGILRRVARWLFVKGKEELEKELEKQRGGSPDASAIDNNDMRPPTRRI